MSAAPASPPGPAAGHLPVLDGVRAHSIVLVLATHLLPLNALWAPANDSLGYLGMALFFVLSGYLIGGQLSARVDWQGFVVQRLARIVPLAWLFVAVAAVSVGFSPTAITTHLLFVANLLPGQLRFPFDAYWSLCVEVQFYALAALLLVLPAPVTRAAIPLLLLAVTGSRLASGATLGSATGTRIDDILAGATLALWLGTPGRLRAWLAWRWLPGLAAALLCACCVVGPGLENPLNYLRPYAAALWLGALICQPASPPGRWLAQSRWRYLARISYALYLVHLPLTATWLGSGQGLEKYLKRPLLILAAIGLAHLSTFHFEQRFTDWGHRFQRRRRERRRLPRAGPAERAPHSPAQHLPPR
ncbi:MAG: acyltransferase [Rubrivivax sp.]